VCDEFGAAASGIYGVGDVARWFNPLFGCSMRIEIAPTRPSRHVRRGQPAAPDSPRPFASVPYFWSDRYDLKIQSHGYLREHQGIAVLEGWRRAASSSRITAGAAYPMCSPSTCRPRPSGCAPLSPPAPRGTRR
jgi:hypothetical protein